MARQLVFLTHEDPEWIVMFSFFEDPEMYNEQYCECLQYMGTVIVDGGAHIEHQFRHRAVPGTNERRYWKVAPSNAFRKRVREGEFQGVSEYHLSDY